jgi:hypothetical protein
VWSGWVGLGTLCGFGLVHPLPGIASGLRIDTAITLPVGVEAYGAYALGAWLTPDVPEAVRRFARRSALGSLLLGMAGQVIYHLLAAAHAHRAPWPVVVLVSCLPVMTLGFGAGLTHLLRAAHLATVAELDTAPDQVAAATTPATAVTAYTPSELGPDTIRTPHPDTAEDPDTIRTPHLDTAEDRPLATTTTTTAARLRGQYPDMTTAEIAWWLGVSDRTVRRHLATSATPSDSLPVAA